MLLQAQRFSRKFGRHAQGFGIKRGLQCIGNICIVGNGRLGSILFAEVVQHRRYHSWQWIDWIAGLLGRRFSCMDCHGLSVLGSGRNWMLLWIHEYYKFHLVSRNSFGSRSTEATCRAHPLRQHGWRFKPKLLHKCRRPRTSQFVCKANQYEEHRAIARTDSRSPATRRKCSLRYYLVVKHSTEPALRSNDRHQSLGIDSQNVSDFDKIRKLATNNDRTKSLSGFACSKSRKRRLHQRGIHAGDAERVMMKDFAFEKPRDDHEGLRCASGNMGQALAGHHGTKLKRRIQKIR